jgi:hypothetical protein
MACRSVQVDAVPESPPSVTVIVAAVAIWVVPTAIAIAAARRVERRALCLVIALPPDKSR